MASQPHRANLADLIFRHYLRSALLPVLTIEVALVAAYFLVNAWSRSETEGALRAEVRQILPHLASQEASRLQGGFSQIAKEATQFAREHEALLADPAKFPVRGPTPELARAPNGTWYQSNRTDQSSLFWATTKPLTAQQRDFAIRSAALDPLYRHLVVDIPNVVAAYYNTTDNMNRLRPFIPKVWELYPADLRMADYNFFYLADPTHDPKRNTVWTGAYLDPAGQGWMISCIAPAYRGDSLHGVVGMDVTIREITENLLKKDLPWKSSAFLVDDSGMILAMPEPVESLLGLHELKGHVYDSAIKVEQRKPREFNLLANPDTTLASDFARILRDTAALNVVRIRGEETFLVQSRIPETGWRLFLVARSHDVFRSVEVASHRARLVGWFVVGAMLVFYALFFSYLRRNAKAMSSTISRPITDLANATTELGSISGNKESLPLCGIPEIDTLTGNFNTLSQELVERSQALVDASVRERLKDKEAELAFARGRYESASTYLHNVGNLTVRLGSSVMDLQEIVASTEQYPEVFQRLREPGSQAVLERFQEILLSKVIPRLRTCGEEISSVRQSIHDTIEHQQREFLEGRDQQAPEIFDLSDCLAEVCREFSHWSGSGRVQIDATGIQKGILVTNHRIQIKNGLVNLLKNAFESIGSDPGRILVSLDRPSETAPARVVIEDDGAGIAPIDQQKLFRAGFTTKPWGHGLGLHSLAVFLSSHGGRIALTSEGTGKGAKVVMEVGDA